MKQQHNAFAPDACTGGAPCKPNKNTQSIGYAKKSSKMSAPPDSMLWKDHLVKKLARPVQTMQISIWAAFRGHICSDLEYTAAEVAKAYRVQREAELAVRGEDSDFDLSDVTESDMSSDDSDDATGSDMDSSYDSADRRPRPHTGAALPYVLHAQ